MVYHVLSGRAGGTSPLLGDSGNTRLIDDLLIDDEVQIDLQKLVKGEAIRCAITTQLSFEDIDTPEGLYSLLLFSGYLNPKRLLNPGLKAVYELTIPNEEVRQIYSERILKWVTQKLNVNGQRYHDFVHLLVEGDYAAFEKTLQEYLHDATSFHQTGKNVAELFYQRFMMCLLGSLGSRYLISSEQEGGKGRSDALLIPKPDQGTEALVLEYKVTQEATKLPTVAQEGIKQILELGIAQPARQHDHVRSVRTVCLAFSGKEVALATKAAP